MIDWLIVGVYGSFLAIAVATYLLSGFVFIGIGHIDNYYQERYFKKHFSKKKVTAENKELSQAA
jgi:hypothetical protein